MKVKDCPICYPIPMGLSPEGWVAVQKTHEEEHLPHCPTCKQPIKE